MECPRCGKPVYVRADAPVLIPVGRRGKPLLGQAKVLGTYDDDCEPCDCTCTCGQRFTWSDDGERVVPVKEEEEEEEP